MLSFKKERLVFKDIPVSIIEANPNQPRKTFGADELSALAQSITRYGIINPLTVRQQGDKYELISGERRLRAAIMAGLSTVPCHIMGADTKKSAEIAIVENVVRSDLDFFEEALALQRLSEDFHLTQKEIAEKIGKTQSAVANKIRLLKLSPDTIKAIRQYCLTERHGRALLRIEDPIVQCAAAQHIGEKSMTVAQAEVHIDHILRNKTKNTRKQTKILVRDLRLFINSVQNHVASLMESGINAGMEKTETDGLLTITVKIPK